MVRCHQGERSICRDVLGVMTTWQSHGVVDMERLEEEALPFGGLDTLSPDRRAGAEKTHEAIDDVWNHWKDANDAVTDLIGRIEALEVFRQ